MKISRYVILFSYGETYLLYNSKNGLFLELSKDLYNDISDFAKEKSKSILEDSVLVESLKSYDILTTEQDDNIFVDQLVMEDYMRSFSTNDIFITFAPTIWCNLKCPYCYETKKSKSIVSEEVCDKIIEFILKHKYANRLHLTWYGGEPLLAIDRVAYFLDKLKQTNINLVEHNIITNATLFNDNVIQVFLKYPLDNIQITLDGPKEKHDQVRIRHDGRGTFDTIMSNLDIIIRELETTNISIRVNTGKHNQSDFFEIENMLKSLYSDNNKINVYPGILVGDNDCGFTSNFFSPNELSNFHYSLITHDDNTSFPKRTAKGCIANNIYGYVIGPEGEIYKCWDDIGFKDKEIGSVMEDGIRNKLLLQRYMLYSSFRNDKKCLGCKLLPNCHGGCPHHRLENYFEGTNKNLCSHLNLQNQTTLKETLYRYYLAQKNKHQ